MSEQPNPVEDRKAFEDAIEEQRQEFIETDIEMHKATDDDAPVSVDGDLAGTPQAPAKKAKKK